MKRSRKLLVFLGIFVILLGGYAIMSQVTKEPVEEEETESITVKEFDAGDVTQMTWEWKEETISLIREDADSDWQYADDSIFPVKQLYASNMLSAIEEVTASQQISDPEDLSEYGLDEPDLKITITTASGDTTFAFGTMNSITSEYYVIMDDDTSEVWMISSSLRTPFAKTLYDIVENEEIPSMSDVTALSVNSEDQNIRLLKIDDPSAISYSEAYYWFWINEDEYKPVDETKTSELYEVITGLSWSECINYNASAEELKEYGLDNPKASVQLSYMLTETVETDETDDDGNAITQEQVSFETFDLEIGNYSDSYSYARLSGSNMVYLIDATVADTLLFAAYDNLRPDTISSINWSTVTSFDIELNGESYTIQYDGTETIENEDGEEETSDVYTCDGEKLDTSLVNSLQNWINTMNAAENIANAAGKEEIIRFIIRRDAESYKELTLTYYAYDSSYYLAEFNGEASQLVYQSSVSSLISAAEALFAEAAADETNEDSE